MTIDNLSMGPDTQDTSIVDNRMFVNAALKRCAKRRLIIGELTQMMLRS